jgi:hypothetical protein
VAPQRHCDGFGLFFFPHLFDALEKDAYGMRLAQYRQAKVLATVE